MSRRFKAFVPFAVVAMVALGAAILTANPSELEADFKMLGSQDARQRKNTVDKLSKGGSRMRGILVGELEEHEHSPLTKAGMITVIRNIGVTASVAQDLRDLLKSDDPLVRQAGVTMLADGPSYARAELAAILLDGDEHELMRQGAGHALSQSGAGSRAVLKKALAAEDATVGLRIQLLRCLATIGTKGIQDVVDFTLTPGRDKNEQRCAVHALSAGGGACRNALANLCKAPQSWVRAEATTALGGLGDSSDTKTLVAQAADLAADVRLAALRSLIDRKATVSQRKTVVTLLGDPDPRIQALAAHDVAQNVGNDFVTLQPILRGLLASGNFKVRYEAALALFSYKDKFGAAAMLADQNTPKMSQQLQAAHAYNLITKAK